VALEGELKRIQAEIKENRSEIVTAFKGIADALETQVTEIRRLTHWAPTVDAKLDRVALKTAESSQRVEDMSMSIEHSITRLRSDVADVQALVFNGKDKQEGAEKESKA